jgi:hypothetical protein
MLTAQITGEPREIERLTRGSEGGRWKSTHRGNSLAAYPTACTVLNGGDEETYRQATRLVPTQLESGLWIAHACGYCAKNVSRMSAASSSRCSGDSSRGRAIS